MEHIVFLDRETIAEHITVPRPDFPHRWTEYDRTDKAQIQDRLKEATIAITNKVPLRKEDLQSLPHLKLIAVAATGYDRVDVDYCHENQIAVVNVRGYAAHTVPEHAFALILALKRNLIAYAQDVANGSWETAQQFCFFDHPIQDLAGSRLGIVGSGSIGKSMAHLGRAFGMEVMLCERKGEPKPRPGYTLWQDCLEGADILSVHCPLNDQTRNLITYEDMCQMKPGALLINVSRGGIICEEGLVRALNEGRISGAGFDVASTEPLTKDNPLKALFGQSNFILTPHVAWASDQAQQAAVDQMIETIEAFQKGTPRNLV